MKLEREGKDLIAQFEGLKLKSYLCPAGVWTIGYGTTRINGKPVTKGMTITKEQAEEYLESDVRSFENAVNDLVDVDLNQNQFDALVCFVYNVGIGNFKKSTLLKLLNQKEYDAAADQFLRWNKAAGKVLAGLTRRRRAERELFLR